MPRGTPTFNAEAQSDTLAPVILVRIMDIPKIGDASTKQSLYLTDIEEDVTWNGDTYLACALNFNSVERSIDGSMNSCSLSIDNINRNFSDLARQYEVNGARVDVLRGFRSTLSSADGFQYVFSGKIKAFKMGQYNAEAEVTTGFGLDELGPKRLYWPSEFPHLPSSKDPASVFTRE